MKKGIIVSPIKRFYAAVFTVFVFLTVGCTHTYHVQGFKSDPANLKNFKDKKVAVVFTKDLFPNRHQSSSQGHTFVFEDMSAFYQEVIGSSLEGYVDTVDFFVHEAPTKNYEVYLYPSLNLEVVPSGIGSNCNVKYTLEAKDQNGIKLATRNSNYEYFFTLIANCENACKTAMIISFADATYKVYNDMDRL